MTHIDDIFKISMPKRFTWGMSLMPRNLSEIVLVVINIFPLIAVWFLDWKLFEIFFLYWTESAIIGFYWYAKLITIFIFDPKRWTYTGKFISTLLFFAIHFSGFMLVHLVIMTSIIGFRGVGTEWSTVFTLWESTFITTYWVVASLFISHGISYIANFFIGKEYKKYIQKHNKNSWLLPYERILIMHFSVFLAIGLMIAIPVSFSLSASLIIFVKICTDLRAHRRSHDRTLYTTPTQIPI